MNNYHKSVLLDETIDLLDIQKDEKYIDATFGGGGHTSEVLKRGGKVLGIDTDKDAIENAQKTFNNDDLILVQGNFKEIRQIAEKHDFINIKGVLFDLGVSSHQFDEVSRGFSFRYNAPLDMRMDKTLAVTAKDLVNGLTEPELTELFTKLGEERFAKRIAHAIAKRRLIEPITTTEDLANLVTASKPYKGKVHPATQVFQALRIAVNDELNVLREALPQSFEILKSGGRLAIITFHSLEDRIVKHFFIDLEHRGKGKILTKRPLTPTDLEIQINKRSRSAKLRAIEKT
jgi:16S rRNA (cytosine1402-N4)-methyltransferase